MAVYKSKPEEIPKDAVLLSEEEAYSFQMKLIKGWDPQKDVWALRYAPGFLGALSSVTGILINNHFRNKFKLGHYGRLSSYLPIVVLPAIVSVIYHRALIQKSIILNPGACPICTELQSAAFQSCLGVIYPTILSPLASLVFATRHYTFRLPSITEKPKEVFALVRKMAKPIVPSLGAALIGHALIATFLTHKEMTNYYGMQLKLQEMEDKAENNALE